MPVPDLAARAEARERVGPTRASAPRWYAEMVNPETLARAEQAMTPAAQATPWLRDLYTSGLADTLYQATGRVPRKLDVATTPDMAAFVSPIGSVHMSPDRARYEHTVSALGNDPSVTFAHEMGHRYTPPRDLPPLKTSEPALWAMDPRKADPTYWRDGQPTALSRSLEAVDPYWRKNEDEARAQAFANAVAFLRETGQRVPEDVRQRLGEREAQTPGMGMIVRDLLSRDPYTAHPLRKVVQ